jgi:hypothetical protein
MNKKLIDYDPTTRTSTWHYYDHATGETHIETVQDTQNTIDINKAVANSGLNQKKGDMWWFARIPNGVIMKLKKEHGLDIFNKDDLKKVETLIMRDPEYRYLRTF